MNSVFEAQRRDAVSIAPCTAFDQRLVSYVYVGVRASALPSFYVFKTSGKSLTPFYIFTKKVCRLTTLLVKLSVGIFKNATDSNWWCYFTYFGLTTRS